jgi:hypothetical protein
MVPYFCFWMSIAVVGKFDTLDFSDAKTLIGIIRVGSTALALYNSVPVSCCKVFMSLSEGAGLVVSASTYCILAPYIGEFHVCGACSGRAGAARWFLCKAGLMYPGIDRSTVWFL